MPSEYEIALFHILRELYSPLLIRIFSSKNILAKGIKKYAHQKKEVGKSETSI